MSDDTDEEISELDIETRTWNKLQATMKLFGFREGAAEGKNLSLQKGFNLGYLDGFKLGEYLGTCEGIISSVTELKLKTYNKRNIEETLSKLSSQPCTICLFEKDTKMLPSKDNPFENLENLASMQCIHSNKIIEFVKQSNLESYYNIT